MSRLSNILNGLLNMYALQTFSINAVTIPAGPIGTLGATETINIAKPGYTPVQISIVKNNHPAWFHVTATIYRSTNMAYVYFYRTTSIQEVESAGGVEIDVLYKKS